MHHHQDLIHIFNDCFELEYNTRLVKGDGDPLYLPADEHRTFHAIFFAHGFFSSALHESAHWLIAGHRRRKQIDYGYWYAPDGRTPDQQRLFQHVEVKPQALEWILSDAARHPFQVSMDNLNGTEADTDAFKSAVRQQVLSYQTQGLSTRAERFRVALDFFYKKAFQPTGEQSTALPVDP